MKVSKALEIIENISNSTENNEVEVMISFIVSPLSDIKKIIKQENGIFYKPDNFIKYYWGTIKLGNITVIFRDKKSYKEQIIKL